MPTQAPSPPEFAPTGERAPSLWPDSVDAGQLGSTSHALTGFDAAAGAAPAASAVSTFDVCHPGLALRALLIVQGVLAVVALATAAGPGDWLARQGALAFAGAGATLAWLIAVCALRQRLARLGITRRLLVVLGLGAAAALAAWWPLRLAGLADSGAGLRLAGVPLAGAAFAALIWGWLELRSLLWQPATANARLAELQSRIRPHFLFNALNTAVALVRVDPSRAEALLEDLSELFRVALADVGSSVSLDEEVELARRYLAIEEARFGNRLQVNWAIEPRAGAARVPPLVLQPLVENAVRHGVEPSARACRVRVRAAARRGQAVIEVHNTLGDEPSQPGHGMALANVRERLRLLHDIGAQLDTWRDAEGFHARITVPLE